MSTMQCNKSRADIRLIRVREFLNYVVPSNTLSSEEFKARCIDVMTGSVRRTEEVSSYKSLSRLITNAYHLGRRHLRQP